MSDNAERFETKGFPSPPIIKHSLFNEVLEMNKYHLIAIIQRLKMKPKFPRGEHVLIPFGIFLATLIPLYTSTFKDSFGFKAETWYSFTIMAVVFSAIITVIFFGLWIRNCICYKEKTADEIVEEVINQMERDKEKMTLGIQEKKGQGR